MSAPPAPASSPRLVNLGCGRRFHREWLNFDLTSPDPAVTACDLRQGLPLPDASCDAVYHSHVLEHIPRDEAAAFLRECFRVLRPGGVLRIAVPDLETICRLYLEKLAAAAGGDPRAAADYDWLMLELYDQAVRETPGGGMAEQLARAALPNAAFVRARLGEEAAELVRAAQTAAPPRPWWQRVLRRPRLVLDALATAAARLAHGPDGPRALAAGTFRAGGEIHRWMYDRWSLAQLLRAAGFEHPAPTTARSSAIPGWERYHLDTLDDGTVVKPDSLFMEARRPSAAS